MAASGQVFKSPIPALPVRPFDPRQPLPYTRPTSPSGGITHVSREIEELQATLRQFAAERDWEQFHTPKNLAASLSIEAAEVLEHFQWLTDEQSRQLTGEQREKVGHEIADVLLYLLQLSDQLSIDPLAAAREKLAINAAKYPADKARGSSKKYTEL